MNIPTLMPHQFEPFNNDTFIQSEFLKLKDKFNINIAIETGSCLGGTTKWLSENFNKVFTIEISEQYRNIMLNHCKNTIDKITSYLGDSGTLIESALLTLNNTDNVIFFLDAHWYDHCSLQSELSNIAKYKSKFNNCIIAIHDFKVPNENLGFDSFKGQDFTFEWLSPYFNQIYSNNKYKHYYNTFDTATDVKRGIIYLTPLTNFE